MRREVGPTAAHGEIGRGRGDRGDNVTSATRGDRVDNINSNKGGNASKRDQEIARLELLLAVGRHLEARLRARELYAREQLAQAMLRRAELLAELRDDPELCRRLTEGTASRPALLRRSDVDRYH